MNKERLKPCLSCIYYKLCGESTRTQFCAGRKTKKEIKKEKKDEKHNYT